MWVLWYRLNTSVKLMNTLTVISNSRVSVFLCVLTNNAWKNAFFTFHLISTCFLNAWQSLVHTSFMMRGETPPSGVPSPGMAKYHPEKALWATTNTYRSKKVVPVEGTQMERKEQTSPSKAVNMNMHHISWMLCSVKCDSSLLVGPLSKTHPQI